MSKGSYPLHPIDVLCSHGILPKVHFSGNQCYSCRWNEESNPSAGETAAKSNFMAFTGTSRMLHRRMLQGSPKSMENKLVTVITGIHAYLENYY
jgi:hypothetical protein